MKLNFIGLLLLTMTISTASRGQVAELFQDENKLSECRVDIPLTYKKRDKPTYIKGATENKDIKLVLVHYNKKTKQATYTFYYIVVDNSLGETFVYLQTPEQYSSKSKTKQAVFVKFTTKYDRFYKAECFESLLAANPNLKKTVKQG